MQVAEKGEGVLKESMKMADRELARTRLMYKEWRLSYGVTNKWHACHYRSIL